MSNEYGYQGSETAQSSGTQYNSIEFIAQYLINGMATATLVQVMAVTNSGGVSPVGLVDIMPLINQLDGYGNPVAHNIIHNCPYLRIQGGANAIIIDPIVGDTGIAIFCDKDVSTIIANQLANAGATSSTANPGSFRRFSFSDGLYLGGVLNGTPTQYIEFSASSVNITSLSTVHITAPSTVTVTSPQANFTGNVSVGTGATGTFSTGTGATVSVQDGIITNIY